MNAGSDLQAWFEHAHSATLLGVIRCGKCNASCAVGQKFCEYCGSELRVAPQPAPGGHSLIGSLFAGKYKIEKLLGEGGMGAVYLAEQTLGTGTRRVALKVLHLELSKDPKIRARFEREAGTVAKLEHPNTIRLFDYGRSDDGTLYIVMEFAQGKTLADVLASDGAFAPERASRVLGQMAGALAEAHAAGIVHRDLKPENIMLLARAGHHDFVKVLDFGIAKSRDDEAKGKLTQIGTVLGTPPYMSPEQFTGAPLDARSDIYSLGVVAYEMITGKLPFEASLPVEWATLHMTTPPRPLEESGPGSRAPHAMRDAIYKALRKIPSERFATMEEFAAALSMDTGPRVAKTAEAAAPPAAQRARTESAPPINVGIGVRPGGTVMGELAPPAAYHPPSYVAPAQPAYAQQPYAPMQSQAYGAPVSSDDGRSSRKGLILALSLLALACMAAVVYGASTHYDWFAEEQVPITQPQTTPPAVVPPPRETTEPAPPVASLSEPAKPASAPPLAPAKPPTGPATPTKPPTNPTQPKPPAPTPQPPAPTPQPPAPTPQPPAPTPQPPVQPVPIPIPGVPVPGQVQTPKANDMCELARRYPRNVAYQAACAKQQGR